MFFTKHYFLDFLELNYYVTVLPKVIDMMEEHSTFSRIRKSWFDIWVLVLLYLFQLIC